MSGVKERIKEVLMRKIAFLIPIFQFIPAIGPWCGIMSIPVIAYFLMLISIYSDYPDILALEISYLLNPRTFIFEKIVVLVGFALFVYSAIYLHKHKNGLTTTGPYSYVRHPQYLGLIIMTFGFTLMSLNTPLIGIVISVWLIEILAYIILAKIEEYHLRSKFGDKYIQYMNSVPFMIPFLRRK